MAQLFQPRFGFLVTLGLLAGMLLTVIAVLVSRGVSADPAGLNEALEQPVPFSHKHHVGDVGIDCRYCHASVEESAFAGIPPLSTCMTCHSQLFTQQQPLAPLIDAYRTGIALHWQRLNKLPDFVYFNHSAHVAHGVGCVSCHGVIDQMPLTARVVPLTMKWCLACHRDPGPQLRPRDEIFNLHWQSEDSSRLGPALLAQYHIDARRLTDCSVCHR